MCDASFSRDLHRLFCTRMRAASRPLYPTPGLTRSEGGRERVRLPYAPSALLPGDVRGSLGAECPHPPSLAPGRRRLAPRPPRSASISGGRSPGPGLARRGQSAETAGEGGSRAATAPVSDRPGPGAGGSRLAAGGDSAVRAMALGSAWKQMSWLYYQYLLVTALYMLEPWERTVFSILLPAARGVLGGELWDRVGCERCPGAVAEAGWGGGALGVVRGEMAGLQPARA